MLTLKIDSLVGTVDVWKGKNKQKLRQNFPVAANDSQPKFCLSSPTGPFKSSCPSPSTHTSGITVQVRRGIFFSS